MQYFLKGNKFSPFGNNRGSIEHTHETSVMLHMKNAKQAADPKSSEVQGESFVN